MVSMPSKNLAWLPLVVIALTFVAAFALSDPWDRVLSGLAVALILAHRAITWAEKRRARQAGQSSSAAVASSD